ncbi:MAG: UDP-glucose 4-epimerase GalE [Erysipelotrichaceae bacterium]
MKILVTGGTGFIGSHTVVELIEGGYEVVIVDNFSNSERNVLDKIKTITNVMPKFYEGNVCDKVTLEKIFEENKIDCVIHFAGFKAVGESVAKPLMYYENNLMSTITLCNVMGKNGCKNIVFSSSATVYGDPHTLPIMEDFPTSTTNPYGSTKLMGEMILKDLFTSDNEWGIGLLRYFNPVGAHKSGLIGENPKDIPNNLMPFIMKVAIKELPCLSVFGNDYNTSDGTGVRDYIHVVDLAKGHLKAVDKICKAPGVYTYNLGTGHGYSVLDLVNTFKTINNVDIPYKITERRPGDIAACYADPKKAQVELNWEAKKDINEMCKDAYNFVINTLNK